MELVVSSVTIFISPSIEKELKNGERKQLQYVMLSWEREGRDIHHDMKILVDKFKSMPKGNYSDFDFSKQIKEYDNQLTGKDRVIVSPLFME